MTGKGAKRRRSSPSPPAARPTRTTKRQRQREEASADEFDLPDSSPMPDEEESSDFNDDEPKPKSRKQARAAKASKKKQDPKAKPKAKARGARTDDDDDEVSSAKADDDDAGPKKAKGKAGRAKKLGTRSAIRKARTKAVAVTDSLALDKHDQALAAHVSAYLESNDTTLSNTKKITTALNHTKLLRIVDPSKPQHSAAHQYLGAVLEDLEPFADRNVCIRSIINSPKKECWDIVLYEPESDKHTKYLPVGNYCTSIPFTDISSDDSNRDTVRQIADVFTHAINCWPWPKMPGDQHTKRALLNLAFSQVLPTFPKMIKDVSKGSHGFIVLISYFDITTGAVKQVETGVAPTDGKMHNVRVPPLPPLTLLSGGKRAGVKTTDGMPYLTMGEGTISGKKSRGKKFQTSTASEHLAQDALRYVALQCNDVVATPKDMDHLIAFWKSKVGIEGNVSVMKTGLYGGSGLYTVAVRSKDRYQAIHPSVAVRRDISPTLSPDRLAIFVRSLNANRVTPVLDAEIHAYTSQASGDVRHAIIEGAKTADRVNLDIAERIPASSHCDCDDAMSATELHGCECCARPVICKSRSFDPFGRLVGPECIERQRLAAKSDDRKTSLAHRLVRRNFTKSFRIECGLRGLDPDRPRQKAVAEAALDKLFSDLPAGQSGSLFVDAYTGRTEEIAHEVPLSSGNPSKRRLLPNSLSVDAVFPYAISDEPPRYWVHGDENVEITSTANQYAKYMSLPATLALISDYVRLENPSAADQEKLIEVLRGPHLLRLKEPYHKAARTKGKVSESQYEKVKMEWACGKPAPGEHGPWEEAASRYITREVTLRTAFEHCWDFKTRNRLGNLASEIAKKHGKQLLKASDGAPWFGLKEAMPGDWSWAAWTIFCEKRLDRMRLICNKKWQTIDTAESLFAEIIFQCTYPGDGESLKQWGDALGLPLVLWLHHPLRLSIGHKNHGSGMWSGWPPHPSSLSERSDDQNMLIESWFWNCAKQDIDESYYGQLATILRSTDMPVKYFDPSLDPPTEVDAELGRLREADVSTQDDAGLQFDADLLEEDPYDGKDMGQGKDANEAEDAGDLAVPHSTEPAEQEQMEVDPAHGEPGDASESLRIETTGARQNLYENFREAWINDGRITYALSNMQKAADAGNRPDWTTANIQLYTILEDYEKD